MSDFTVIGIVGEVLKGLLRSSLQATFDGGFSSTDSVTLASPKDLEQQAVGSNRLSLFLYRIVENPYMKNQPMETVRVDRVRYPPLALNLYYLITPYAPETQEIRGWDAHTILGRAMQVFYDNAILEGPKLRDVLQSIGQEDYYEKIARICIVLDSLSLDDLTKIWNSLDTGMRLSVGYEVRVMMVESERMEEVKRIMEKNADYYHIKGD